MGYKTVLVHCDASKLVSHRLVVAADLAHGSVRVLSTFMFAGLLKRLSSSIVESRRVTSSSLRRRREGTSGIAPPFRTSPRRFRHGGSVPWPEAWSFLVH